jgi:hypothetical protein
MSLYCFLETNCRFGSPGTTAVFCGLVRNEASRVVGLSSEESRPVAFSGLGTGPIGFRQPVATSSKAALAAALPCTSASWLPKAT